MRFRFRTINAKDDIEKAITPTIIYAFNEKHGAAGFSLSIGWWHWGVGIALTWPIA